MGLVEGGLHFRAKGQEAFQHYLHSGLANSISQNTVSKIYEDADSHIWLGNWGGGLDRLDPSGSGFESFVPGDEKGSIASPFVSDVIEDSLHNGLWVGMNNGLQFFDQESEQFLNVFVGSEMPYPPQQVNFLKIDRKQRLWVATNIGLYVFISALLIFPSACQIRLFQVQFARSFFGAAGQDYQYLRGRGCALVWQ